MNSGEVLPPNKPPTWALWDAWIGIAFLVAWMVTSLLISVGAAYWHLNTEVVMPFGEVALLVPVVVTLALRKLSWNTLGFRRFDRKAVGVGCLTMLLAYSLIIIHNIVLIALKIDTQGTDVIRMLNNLNHPEWFAMVAVLMAPLVEEVFFRGYLFAALRQKYNWIASALVSSAIFAIAHLQPVALIPVFIIGFVLAYLFEKYQSIWPGIIMHTAINSLSACVWVLLTLLPKPA